MKKIGIDFIIFNIVVIIGCAAVISGIGYFLSGAEWDFFSICFMLVLVFSPLCLFHLSNNKFTDHVVAQTVKKNVIKYNFDKAHTIYANNTTLMIDTEGGRIAYVSNLNPWKFQLISAEDIDDIKDDYEKGMFPNTTHYVYFQFSYQGKVMKFSAFRSQRYWFLDTGMVQNAMKKAAASADILRAAKQPTLYVDERVDFKITDSQESTVEQETQTNVTQANVTQAHEIQTNEKAEKFNRACGKWMFGIAGLILCINVVCRMVDAGKSMEYEQVMGTVTWTYTSEHWFGRSQGYDYHVGIDYQPLGYLNTYNLSESYSFSMFSKGDTVPVLYRKDAFSRAYVAKKDWMTGAYLPISKWYNVPLIIALLLFGIGFLLYTSAIDFYTYIKHFTTDR